MGDFKTLLKQASSQDQAIQKNAEQQLKNLENQNFSEFLLTLCQQLLDNSNTPEIRQLAGLMLSNAVGGGKSQETVQKLNERWSMTQPNIQIHIKQAVLEVLVTPMRDARRTAAIVIAKIVAAESLENWKDLLPILLKKLQESPLEYKETLLLCLSYIAEEIDEQLEPYTPLLLQAIYGGMNCNNDDVRISAIKCLYSILEIIRSNMQKTEDRNRIMQIVCVSCHYKNPQLRLYGYMSVTRICQFYYDLLQDYIGSIFNLSKQTITLALKKEEEEDVAKQAIEFWSQCAEIEDEMITEQEANNVSNRPRSPNQNFIQKALDGLLPLYFECLLKQSDDNDDETWTMQKAAVCSLILFSKVARDLILNYALKFIENNIMQSNWRQREAATMTFGSILEGPSKKKLLELIPQILPIIIGLLGDSNAHVRRTTAWTFGRICSLHPEAILKCKQVTDGLEEFIKTLIKVINDASFISHYGSWALTTLSEYFGNHYPTNSPLKPYTRQIMSTLLDRCNKNDNDPRVLVACHEALNNLIFYSDKDQLHMIKSDLLPELIKRLDIVRRSNCDIVQKSNMMSSLLSSISGTLQKLGKKCIDGEMANVLMNACIIVPEDSTAFEEALLCISAMGDAIEEDFWNYFIAPQLQNKFYVALQSKNSALCKLTVGALGDLFRVCSPLIARYHEKIYQFSDKIVNTVLHYLISPDVDMEIKSHLIDSLCDIAIGFGENFSRYVKHTLQFTLMVGNTDIGSQKDEDMHLTLNEIRTSVIDMFCSVILNDRNSLLIFAEFVQEVLKMFHKIAEGPYHTDALIEQSCRFFSDLATACHGNIQLQKLFISQFRNQDVQKIIQIGQNSKEEIIQKGANKAMQALR